MDKTEATVVQREICAAVDIILAKHKLKRKTSSASYTDGTLRVTINANSTDPAHDPKIADWKRYAMSFGLPDDGLGRTFTLRGQTWKIIGLDAGRRRYPVVAEPLAGGKVMLFTAEGVISALSR
jgi:hypothetical protein